MSLHEYFDFVTEVKGGGDNDLYNYSSSNEDELFKSVQKKYKGKRKR